MSDYALYIAEQIYLNVKIALVGLSLSDVRDKKASDNANSNATDNR